MIVEFLFIFLRKATRTHSSTRFENYDGCGKYLAIKVFDAVIV
jgi:hypothetical protein